MDLRQQEIRTTLDDGMNPMILIEAVVEYEEAVRFRET